MQNNQYQLTTWSEHKNEMQPMVPNANELNKVGILHDLHTSHINLHYID